MPELPDWLRGLALLGKYGADYISIQTDADGNLYAVLKGEDGGGDLQTLAVDADGQLIIIPRGSSGNYLTVDDDGFLTTVMKGAYGGALRTITLDDAGRLSAYIYDSVDAWGQIASVGFAELAARLGSVVRYERSGQVHWIETFEHGLQSWILNTDGTGASLGLTPVYSQSGGYSCELVGGSDSTRLADITRVAGVNSVGKLGLSFSFAVASTFDWIKLFFKLRTVGTEYTAILYLVPSLDKIYIYDDSPGWVEVCDFDQATLQAEVWSTVKIVVDFDNALYGTVRYNAGTYDMSACGIGSASNAYTPEVSIKIEAKSRDGENDHIYIDDVILTFAES